MPQALVAHPRGPEECLEPCAGGRAGAKRLRVLAVAPVSDYAGFNTSAQRVRALAGLGCETEVVDSTKRFPGKIAELDFRLRSRLFLKGLPVSHADPLDDNGRLLSQADNGPWDVLWIDKGLSLFPATLEQFRRLQPRCRILGYSPDDMARRGNQSWQFLRHLPLYDIFFTTKSYNVAELRELGCGRVVHVGNAYCPDCFRPMPVDKADFERLGGEVGFIGSYEAERAHSMARLAQAGVPVRVWGGGWRRQAAQAGLAVERRPLLGDDYARACCAFKINLCFLRKANRDLQTTRSIEIPACGAFMLAERSEEHSRLFVEGKEAEFFASDEELIDKCKFYLAHDAARQAIAANGLARCVAGGYSNTARMREMLAAALGAPPAGTSDDEACPMTEQRFEETCA